MSLSKREFLQVLGAASAAGLNLGMFADADAASAQPGLYDIAPFGNVSLLHMTDCHAQLMPIHFREPSVNMGISAMQGNLPHLVGDHLLKALAIAPGSAQAYAFTYVDFEQAARSYGKVGGFAHLATLVKQLKGSRPGALLLDGGDTWQGSATSLWTQAQDMVDACKLLGVDVMTGHWEFTYGMERVKEIVETDFAGKIDFVAHNVKTNDFGDPVFKPYVLREINGVLVAIIGQAFPYTPIANPRYMVADWSFGIQDDNLQKMVDEVRAKGAKVVAVLSHNGMDVDLKMATRVRGVDAIFGGHTHDGVPVAIPVANAGGKTLVTNAGSNGKFLGVMDFHVGSSGVTDFRYRLLPVFSNQIKPDPAMAAEIALSPGFRWGTTLLPGDTITRELMMDQLAITYPYATLTEMSGEAIKGILEDVADNLFNPDPYYQQGGDMVRVGGLSYTCEPTQKMGQRISRMTLGGKPLEASRIYKVAGWAPVAEAARTTPGNKPIWDVVETWLKSQPDGHVTARKVNAPTLIGMADNKGIADA